MWHRECEDLFKVCLKNVTWKSREYHLICVKIYGFTTYSDIHTTYYILQLCRYDYPLKMSIEEVRRTSKRWDQHMFVVNTYGSGGLQGDLVGGSSREPWGWSSGRPRGWVLRSISSVGFQRDLVGESSGVLVGAYSGGPRGWIVRGTSWVALQPVLFTPL